MRSVMTGYMKRHLKTVTHVDGAKIGEQPIDDPFANVNVVVRWTLWEWLKLLFTREMVVRVKVQADGVAIDRWFTGADTCERCCRVKIGQPHDGSNTSDPGYHHGDERWCHDCHYDIPKHQEVSGAFHSEEICT